MLINKTQLDAVKFATKDKTRPNLQRLQFIPDESAVEATDGHKLVRIVNRDDVVDRSNNGENEKKAEPFGINKDVLKTLQDVVKKDHSATLSYNGNGSVDCELPYNPGFKQLALRVDDSGLWPDTKQLIPDDTKDRIRFAFDARYMRDICDLLIKASSDGSRSLVRLEMSLDREDAENCAFHIKNDWYHDTNKIEIVLMPVRL